MQLFDLTLNLSNNGIKIRTIIELFDRAKEGLFHVLFEPVKTRGNFIN